MTEEKKLDDIILWAAAVYRVACQQSEDETFHQVERLFLKIAKFDLLTDSLESISPLVQEMSSLQLDVSCDNYGMILKLRESWKKQKENPEYE